MNYNFYLFIKKKKKKNYDFYLLTTNFFKYIFQQILYLI